MHSIEETSDMLAVKWRKPIALLAGYTASLLGAFKLMLADLSGKSGDIISRYHKHELLLRI
jgi:hypothetical protein